ncbi:MAG: hypothetical protein AABZ47_15120 [Planctomycetota bacterium]
MPESSHAAESRQVNVPLPQNNDLPYLCGHRVTRSRQKCCFASVCGTITDMYKWFLMTRSVLLRLFAGFFLLYALTSSGDLIGDTQVRWSVASRLVDTGWVDLVPGTTLLFAVGGDGKPYSYYGPAQSVCLLPYVLAGRAVAAVAHQSAARADQIGQFLASLTLFPAFGAFAIVLVYTLARDGSQDARTALLVAIVYGLATMHWHHSVTTYEESQVAVCVLGSLWAIRRAWNTNQFRFRLLAVAAMGVALTFRVSSVAMTVPLGLVALGYDLFDARGAAERIRRATHWLFAVLIGVGPFVALLAAYNQSRFGSVWETGYAIAHWDEPGGVKLFDTPLLIGLSGMLFSPGKSLFLFNPVLLAAIPGFLGLWRVQRRLAVAIAVPFVGTLLFHSWYTFWAGDLAWGPRYLASAMGFCVLALIPLMKQPRLPRAVIVLAAVSVCVQVASIIYSFGLEFFQDRRHGTIPDGYVWRPAESQLYSRFRNIILHAWGRPSYESIPPIQERQVTHHIVTSREAVQRLHAINIFPFKAYAATGSRAIFLALLAIWLTGLGLLSFLVYGFNRYSAQVETHSSPECT